MSDEPANADRDADIDIAQPRRRSRTRRMSRSDLLNILLIVVGVLLAACVLGLALLGGPMGVNCLLLYYGWILFLFFHYRYLRQNELIYLLAGAAEAKQSLTSAVWAYLVDRPYGLARVLFEFVLLSAVLPGYWFWHYFHNYDRKVRRLAHLLEMGMPLAEALKEVKGVASSEAVLAASVGQTTGKLAETLRRVPKWRVATLWLEMLPRFLYPLMLLGVTLGILAFLMIFIIPKFEKIFSDFRIKMPYSTELLIFSSRWFLKYLWLFLLTFLAGVVAIIVLFFNPSPCWNIPVVKRFYRTHVQSRVLKMLGLLLEAGETVPQALTVLINTGFFQGNVLRRLETVRNRVEKGEELAGELRRQGLLPESMVALVQSAQRTNHLPWALGELGEQRARTTAVAVQRFSGIFFPIMVLVMALLIGFVAVSMFSPLLRLLDELAPEKLIHRSVR